MKMSDADLDVDVYVYCVQAEQMSDHWYKSVAAVKRDESNERDDVEDEMPCS